MSEVKKTFHNTANVIKKHRNYVKLSQKDLSEKIGCTDKFIANIEVGKSPLPPKMFVKMGRVLEAHPSVFSVAAQIDLKEFHDKVIEATENEDG